MIKKRLLSTIMMVAFCACFAVAQTSTVKHTVNRGETLQSIAKHYAVTEAKIIELNPDAAQFLYVGMELVIPVSQKNVQATSTVEGVNASDNVLSYNTDGKFVKTRSNEYQLTDFAFWGFSYFAPFEDAGKGYYMLGGETFSDSGFGVDFQIGANYGLVDKDYAGVAFLIGPAYGYVYKNILASASLDFIGAYSGTGDTEKTGTNKKGEKYSYIASDGKFNWGIALMPKAAVRLGKITPWAGVNVMWAKGADKVSFGFQVGVGFDIW